MSQVLTYTHVSFKKKKWPSKLENQGLENIARYKNLGKELKNNNRILLQESEKPQNRTLLQATKQDRTVPTEI